MGVWLYQISPMNEDWRLNNPQEYRNGVRENQQYTWDVGTIRDTSNHQSLPVKGDLMTIFFVPTGNDEPGIYGWALINDYADKKITFTPVFPSDYIKHHPFWDDEIENMIKDIRKGNNQGTMWRIS